MLKLQTRKIEYTNKSGVKDSFNVFYVDFYAEAHNKKVEHKFTYDIKISDNNWKELLTKHVDTATVILDTKEVTRDGKTFTIYLPKIQFFINKEKFYVDFKVEEKSVLFLLKVYCL